MRAQRTQKRKVFGKTTPKIYCKKAENNFNWRSVFQWHSKLMAAAKKPSTRNGILLWRINHTNGHNHTVTFVSKIELLCLIKSGKERNKMVLLLNRIATHNTNDIKAFELCAFNACKFTLDFVAFFFAYTLIVLARELSIFDFYHKIFPNTKYISRG